MWAWQFARGYLAGAGPGTNAQTTRGKSDQYSIALGIGSRQDEAIRRRVIEAAERLGVKPAIVAVAWVASRSAITSPIIGASKPHHLDDAIAALELKLDAQTIAQLEEPYAPRAVVGHQ
jgi:aryl-alcohol dehydrogenase-like predicted oxidoreductase